MLMIMTFVTGKPQIEVFNKNTYPHEERRNSRFWINRETTIKKKNIIADKLKPNSRHQQKQ